MLARKPIGKGRIEDVLFLAPFVQTRLADALFECHRAGYMVYPFETLRTPERQQELYDSNTPERWVTSALPWESWHQYGVAIDLAFKNAKGWVWEGHQPWDKVQFLVKDHGFEFLKKEQAHIQITARLNVADARELFLKGGFEAVWAAVILRL